jgi:hypothetical protein
MVQSSLTPSIFIVPDQRKKPTTFELSVQAAFAFWQF